MPLTSTARWYDWAQPHLGFEPSSLEDPGRTLSGFNGSSTTSLGDVTLGRFGTRAKNRDSFAWIPDKELTPDDSWSLHVDRASRSSRSGFGLLLKAPTGERVKQSIRLDFTASNNEVEYEAILSGLGLAITLNASKVKIHNDSQLVVGQIPKEYEAKDKCMAKHLLKVQESLSWLEEWVIEKIPMGDNVQVDALVGIAASFPVKKSTMLPVYVQSHSHHH